MGTGTVFSSTGLSFVDGPVTVWLLTTKNLFKFDLNSNATSRSDLVVSTLPLK
ncbi:MAG: hypothetical protein BWY38_02874 [Ignavibacteria bacterium ADurb.Bin266]|nr:MAG: hypothetical protein BWY38_02874 [Ignavibacteria bacterium ADurb.Bin266]